MAESTERESAAQEPVSTKAPLTFREKLDLPARLLILGPILGFNLTRCLSHAWWRGLPLHFYALTAFMKTMLITFTPRQLQLLTGGSVATYRSWIQTTLASAKARTKTIPQARIKEDIEVLPDGQSSLMWIGDRTTAKKFIYFFHGGGYMLSINTGHLEWFLKAVINDINNPEIAVACLQYGLTPTLKYPGQLRQAVSGLNHMIKSGIDPEDIICGGDSAGGNITFMLLGHMLHPHPGVEPVIAVRPILGAFAISPWIGNKDTTRSWKENEQVDVISTTISDKITDNWLGGTSITQEWRDSEAWAMPADIDPSGSWYDGLDKVVRSLYVTTGKHEMLRDHIISLTQAIRERNPRVDVELQVHELESHDFMILEGMSKMFGESTEEMKLWIRKIIS